MRLSQNHRVKIGESRRGGEDNEAAMAERGTGQKKIFSVTMKRAKRVGEKVCAARGRGCACTL